MSAVSANPLRAPWVEMKYCKTDSPSRKLAVIGVGMISPEGFDIRPRIPAIWRICSLEPRAPESAMMKIGLGSPRGVRTAAHLAEHLVGHLLGDAVPDVNDLVEALARGDDAAGALPLDLLDLLERVVDQPFLRTGNDHVAGADRDAGERRPGEPEVLQGVEQAHRHLVPEPQVGEGNQALQAALLQLAVDERQLRRQRRVEDRAPDRGLQVEVLDPLRFGVQEVLLVGLDRHVEQVAGVDDLDRLQRVWRR